MLSSRLDSDTEGSYEWDLVECREEVALVDNDECMSGTSKCLLGWSLEGDAFHIPVLSFGMLQPRSLRVSRLLNIRNVGFSAIRARC